MRTIFTGPMDKKTQPSEGSGLKRRRKLVSPREKFPKTMPALGRAQRITEEASRLGFDWPATEPVWAKIEEELQELKKAVSSANKNRMREEMGDLFLSLVNLSRFLGLESEEALRQATERFLQRFKHIEKSLAKKGKTPPESLLEEMDSLWEEAKRLERELKEPR